MELWELVAREQCRDTLAQYSHAGDRYRLDEFAGAFCEDGVLEIRGQAPLRGRAAIVERFGGAWRVPKRYRPYPNPASRAKRPNAANTSALR